MSQTQHLHISKMSIKQNVLISVFKNFIKKSKATQKFAVLMKLNL